MLLNILFILFVFIIENKSFVIKPKVAECLVDITQFDPEPIIIEGTTHEFLYPKYEETSPIIRVEPGKTLHISCPGGVITLQNTNHTSLTAECISDNIFQTGSQFNINTIRASRKPYHTARYTNISTNCGPYNEIEIGFIVEKDLFRRQLTVCFDPVTQSAIYSFYNLTRSIGHRESGVARPSFIQDNFYDIGSINTLYTRNEQRKTINRLLGLSDGSQKYVQDSNDFFLARGHLTARADFVYAPQTTATFHYVNAAPQWQTVNGQNWAVIEEDVRNYADLHGLDLQVYTGTYGVAKLPHEETGEDIGLYLYVNGDRSALVVPELFWKVVYEPESRRGLAILALNNPYQKDVLASVICEDVSKEIDWLNWKIDDISRGYGYVCEVDGIKMVIDGFPDLQVDGLLV